MKLRRKISLLVVGALAAATLALARLARAGRRPDLVHRKLR
jgi:hypothetical protein